MFKAAQAAIWKWKWSRKYHLLKPFGTSFQPFWANTIKIRPLICEAVTFWPTFELWGHFSVSGKHSELLVWYIEITPTENTHTVGILSYFHNIHESFTKTKNNYILDHLSWSGGHKEICRLSWLTNSALVYEPKCGGGGGLRGLSRWEQLCTSSPNKLRRTNFIFNQCSWCSTPIKKKTKFSSYIGKFRWDRVQSQIWGRAS